MLRTKRNNKSRTHIPLRTNRMPRDKPIDTNPHFLAIDLERQLSPGTVEHTLNHPIDRELDLSGCRGNLYPPRTTSL